MTKFLFEIEIIPKIKRDISVGEAVNIIGYRISMGCMNEKETVKFGSVIKNER